MKKALLMDNRDNVATTLSAVESGDTIQVLSTDGNDITTITATSSVRFGNKVAITTIPDGIEVFKYGFVIGKSTRDIVVGELVHIHNIESNRINIPKDRVASMCENLGIRC